jgi:hypothetical protein
MVNRSGRRFARHKGLWRNGIVHNPFLIWALDGDEWLPLLSRNTPFSVPIRRFCGTQSRVGALETKEILCSFRKSNHESSLIRPVA